MSDDERGEDDETKDMSEAEKRMYEMKKKKERAAEEWKEYEEMRKAEKEKEDEEIQKLRARREQRKKERIEEEQRLAEQRGIEDQRRRAEEEDRQRKKREEETGRREERERKRRELEERSAKTGKPNFVINKRLGMEEEEAEKEDASKKKEDASKSKEQQEAERKAILEQRIQPLNIAGFNEEQLREKAKEMHQAIYRLESDKYDLEETFKTKSHEMMDLAERARQMNRVGKSQKANVQAEPDPLAEKISGIPPKIVMYSQYERVKDHRSFHDRRIIYKGPNYTEEYERVTPESKVVMTSMGARSVGAYEPPTTSGGGGGGGGGKSNVTNGVAHDSAEAEVTLELGGDEEAE